jgi:FtsH-binding integral membrane protein
MLAMYLQYWALLVLAAAVLAMAWVERSRWLGSVAVAFTTVVVLTSVTGNSLFRLVGWGADGRPQLDVLQDMLLPSAVLLIGGLGGLIGQAVRRRVR